MKPQQLDVIHLGSRMRPFHKLGLSRRVVLLNEVVRAGLPVPNAIVITDGAWQRLVGDGVVTLDGEAVTVHGADELLERVALNRPNRPMAVRAAFAWRHDPAAPLPQRFPACLDVPPDDRNELIEALVTVWHSGQAWADTLRRDLLVLEMVPATRRGIAHTRRQDHADTALAVDTGECVTLERPGFFGRSRLEPGWQRRLQLLLRGVRRSLSLLGDSWEVDWADDGEICRIVSIRPYTTNSTAT
jgi:hypothetical protein